MSQKSVTTASEATLADGKKDTSPMPDLTPNPLKKVSRNNRPLCILFCESSKNNFSIMGKGPVIPKEKRGGRSRKLRLAIPLPALTKRINERKPRDKRMGTRAIVTTAALIEYLCRLLMEDACARVRDGASKTLNVKHIAQSLSDPNTDFYGIFSTRVACVYTTLETDVNEEEDAADAPAEAVVDVED
jgi:hypothetical protein